MKTDEGPWISLPSKQHPNEIYYFNVSKGYSTWERPDNYCEPVGDRKSSQSRAGSTTPEDSESSAYIVESLSPRTSPRKHVHKGVKKEEEQEEEEKEISNLHFQRDRNNKKDHLLKNNLRKSIHMHINDNREKNRYNERDWKTVNYCPLQKQSGSISKQDVVCAATPERSLSSENKLFDPSEVAQKRSNFRGSRTPGKVAQHDKYKGSYYPNFDRNDLASRELKLSDSPIIYGSASLRLERLKKQLSEASRNKNQLPSSALSENSHEKKWQTKLLEPRNRIDDGVCHSRPLIGPSCISASSNSRKSVIPGNGISRVMNLDSISKPFSSNIVSGPLKCLTQTAEHVKPYFIKDYCHSKDPNKSKMFVSKYIDSIPKTVQNDCSQFHSSSVRKLSGNSQSCNYSSALDNKSFFNTYLSTSSSNTFRNVLAKCSYRGEENNRLIAERGYTLKSVQSSFQKPERTSFPQTKVVTRLLPHCKQGEYCANTGSDNYGIYSFDTGRKLPYEAKLLCNSKTPAMDRLRQYRYMQLEVNPLKKQLGGSFRFTHLKYSNIGSFASASDKSLSGKSCVTKTSDYSLRSDLRGIQRKLIECPSIEDIPRNYSSSKNNAKDVETHFSRREVNNTISDWSSQKLVRDYNHKRVADYSENNVKILHDNGKMFKLFEQTEVEKKEVPFKKKNYVVNNLETNVSPSFSGSSKYEHQISCPHESSYDQGKEWCPPKIRRNNVKSDCIEEKQFESSYEKQYTNKIECTVPPSTDMTRVNCAEQGETKLISDSLSQKEAKQKSRLSKGGITRINRKVQKQLRTAAPRSLHLTAATVQHKRFGFTLQSKQMLNKTIKDEEEEEEMDWEPIEPEKIVLHVEELRKEGVLKNDINPELINLCRMDIEITSQWFVVLDTNVLLSHLKFLCKLRDIEDRELGMPTLFIPWIVLQELDGLKSSKTKAALKFYARKAVNFLFDNLLVSHPRVRGQPKSEADKHGSLEPDDSILQCSLNLQKVSTKVLLLTNDHNLFNKATVSGVECCSAAKLVQELESRRSSKCTSSLSGVANKSNLPIHSTVETLKQCLGHVLEEVLRTEMVLVYDRKWSEIVARKPPWTLDDIIFCLLKHWFAVFHFVLPAAARELIEKISLFINYEVGKMSFENVENMVKTCISLMHLVSSLSYKQYVDSAVSTMNMLLQTLEEHKKLSAINSLPASDTLVAADKRDETATNISRTALHIASNFATQNDTHIKCSGSIIGSKGYSDSTSGSGSNIEADEDCLSIFASTFSDDTLNTKTSDTIVCIKKRAELVHKYLNTIFEKVVLYCGMLCDVMGIDPCIQYQRPEPFPSMETLNQNILSYIKCVSSLLRCFQGILANQPNELQENSPVLLNFYITIKDSVPTCNEFEESLLPHHILAYCLQTDTRHQLEAGKKQFEQLQAVLNQALNFFMVQNQSSTPLPSF